jgi:Fe-S cluster assembly protein SufD
MITYLNDPENLIVLEENSQVTLIEIRNSDSDNNTLSRIQVRKNAKLSYFFIQYSKTKTRNHAQISIDLEGPQAECLFHSLVFGQENAHTNVALTVQHHYPACSSRTVSRGVFKDTSKGNFIGKIVVHPHSSKTKAFLETKSLLLSKTAVAHARPQLEIYNGDIQCSHGATVGELEPEALFYLQSRGLEKSIAEQLLIRAFMYPSLQGIPAEMLSYVDDFVDEY